MFYKISLFILALFCFVDLHASAPKKEINLIWQSPKKGLWETDWILELLSDFKVNEIEDGKYEVFVDEAIVVTGYYSGNYFSKLKEKNYKYGVIHISDEVYSHPVFFYNGSSFVFRNYWHKQFAETENVRFFALGYKQGLSSSDLENQIRNSAEREFTWSFAGGIVDRPGRFDMISNMQKVPNYYFHEIFQWNDPHSLKTQDYRSLLLSSVFVPCPRGYWNLDSFRVYEALECGCIPIVERKPTDYFNSFFGKHPFLSVSSWDEAPGIINALLLDPFLLEQVRLNCHRWWMDYKKKTRKEFKTVIEKAFFDSPVYDIKELRSALGIDPADALFINSIDSSLSSALEAGSSKNSRYIVVPGVVEAKEWNEYSRWADVVDFLARHSEWRLRDRRFGQEGLAVLERREMSEERAVRETEIDKALKNKVILCTGPAFNKKKVLKEVTEKDQKIIPFKKIFLTTNDPEIMDVVFNETHPVVEVIECHGHQLDCLNCIISSIRNAVNDPDCLDDDIILFKHESASINDMYLVRQAIGKVLDGYDYVSRYWAPDDFYMTNHFFLKVGAAREIFKDQALVTAFDENYKFCEDYWTKALMSRIDKVYKIDYAHATRKSTELGFYHAPRPSEEFDDGYWDMRNYLELFK